MKYEPDYFPGTVTGSVFEITKSNVLTPDPDDPNFQVQTGEVRHRGFELETVVNLFHGVSLTGSYTYLDAEITSSNVEGETGNRPALVPEHQASLWAKYTFETGVLEGLNVGSGVRYVGSSFGDNANQIKVDDPIPSSMQRSAMRRMAGRGRSRRAMSSTRNIIRPALATIMAIPCASMAKDAPSKRRFRPSSSEYVMNGTAFSLNGISYDIDGRTLLHPLTLDIPRGEVVGILGHNGSGKSTLLKILARFQSPTRGRVECLGQALGSFRSKEYAQKGCLSAATDS